MNGGEKDGAGGEGGGGLACGCVGGILIVVLVWRGGGRSFCWDERRDEPTESFPG